MDQGFTDRMRERLASEQSRTRPPGDFPGLPPIPGGRYRAPEFLALEERYLWRKAWLYAGHAGQLPEPGSYFLWRKTGSPILLVRGADREIRAFYNACRHRGGPLVSDDSGRVKRGFTCAFHGWAYDLEGRLRGVRDRQDFVGIEPDCLGLVNVRCERLGNWIFVSEDPQAPPLADSLGPIAGQLRQFDLDDIRFVERRSYDIECNVKLMMEAFLEVYHLRSVHSETVDRFLDYRGSSMVLWPDGHSLMVTPNRNPDWVDPGARDMPEFPNVGEFPSRNNVSYNIFPNLITPVAATGMPVLTFWPVTGRAMRLDCDWYSPDWGDGERHPRWDRRIANFERILQEDLEYAPRLQQSVESRGFTGSLIGYQERRIYHWHEELDRRIGPERIPAHLRVEPRLAGLVEHRA